MKKITKILHLEDDEKDAMLIHETINSELTFCKIKRVDNKKDFSEALRNEEFDLIISDFALPSFNGLEALTIAKDITPDTPYIYVSGHIGEERAIEALKMGATDYVLKDKPAKLIPAIYRALREIEEKEKRRNVESALKESERFSKSALDSVRTQLAVIEEEGEIIFVNKLWKESFENDSPVPQGLPLGENYLEKCRKTKEGKKFATGIMSVINGYTKEYMQEYPCSSLNSRKWYLSFANKFEGEGPVRLIITHVDITDRKRATERIELSEKRYKALFDQNPNAILEYTHDAKLIAANKQVEKITGTTIDEFETFHLSSSLTEESKAKASEYYRRTLEGKSLNFDLEAVTKDGSHKIFNTTSIPIIINNKTEGLFGVLQDITEERLSEEKIKQYISQLETAIAVEQKILTSDFNIDNIMNLIILNAQEITQADGAALGMIEHEEINFKVDSGIYKNFEPLILNVNTSLSGHCYKTGEFIICQDADKNEIVNKAVCRKMGIRSLFIFPLNYNNKIIGILNIAYKEPNAIKEEYISLMKLLLVFLASAISLAEKFELNRRLNEEKAKALELLQESESKYRLIAEHSTDMISRHKDDGLIIYASPASEKIIGYKPDELLGTYIQSLIYPGDLEKQVKYYAEFRQQGEILTSTYRLRKKNGNYTWVETTSMKVFNKGLNKVESIISNTRDVSERVKHELELRESEYRYRNLFESAPIGVARISPDGYFIDSNLALHEMLGYPSEELKETRIMDITFPQDRVHSQKLLDSILNSDNNIVKFEKRYVSKSGKIIWANVTSTTVKNENGEVLYLVSMVENINDKKAAELALRENEEKYRMLFEKNLAGVYLSTVGGKIISCNQSFADIYGYNSPDELYNIDASKLYINPRARKDFINKLMEKGELKDYESPSRRRNGEEIWVLENVELTYSQDGKDSFIFGTLLDITERKKAEAEILEAKERAEEMSRLKSSFLANMSHELRTPLIGILGFSQILNDELTNNDQKEMTNTIIRSGNRLLETLNLILDLSRIEADKVEIVPEPFNAIETISDVLELLKTSADKKNLSLRLLSELSSVEMKLDKKIFLEIIENLVNNAIKFTPKGSVVVRVETKMQANRDIIVVKVIDTGIGIPKESVKYIFDEFRQVSEGYSRSFEGSGLGLTITKKYIDKLRGEIEVESEVGQGSTFTVRLPIIINAEDKPNASKTTGASKSSEASQTPEVSKISGVYDSPNPQEAENLERQKILLVEDDETSQLLTGMYLKSKYDVHMASNAKQAIQKSEENKYDLILMDINLGAGMNGTDATREIRKNPVYKNVPVIATTAYAMKGDREKFLAAGLSNYLSKPFTKAQLLNIIEESLK